MRVGRGRYGTKVCGVTLSGTGWELTRVGSLRLGPGRLDASMMLERE